MTAGETDRFLPATPRDGAEGLVRYNRYDTHNRQ
jgi:hypothetical protein